MKKPLLTEAQIQRFQQLAGIKPLYEQEAGEEDLPLNNVKKEVDNATDKIENNIDEITNEVTEDNKESVVEKLTPLYNQVVADLKEMDNTKEKKEKLQNSLLLSWKAIGGLSVTPFILKLLGIGPSDVTQVVDVWTNIWGKEKSRSYDITDTAFMEGFLILAALMAIYKVYLYIGKAYTPGEKDIEEQGGVDVFNLDDIDDIIFKAINASI